MTTTQTKPKAYSYLRFSTPEQMKGDSYRRQIEAARRYSLEHDLDLDEQLTFEDLGVSAYTGRNKNKGALKVFRDAVDHGDIEEGSYLLVENLDRVSRETPRLALALFLELIDNGIVIVTLMDGKEYSKGSLDSNEFEIMMSLMSMIRAHSESEVKARRLRAAWQNKRSKVKEKILTARTPAWIKTIDRGGNREFVVIPERGEVVKRIFRMTLKGQGQTSIAKTLNEEGVPVFGRGKYWHRTYIRKILDNEAAIGILIPHTQEYTDKGKKIRKPQGRIEKYYPKIIDEDTFGRVQALHDKTVAPLRGRHSGKTVNNIFGGLAKCPLCGATFTLVNKGSSRKAGKPYLVCARAKEGAGCKYKAIPYDTVEETFLDKHLQVLNEMPLSNKAGEIQERIWSINGAIGGLVDSLQDLDRESRRGKSQAITRRKREIEQQILEMEKEQEELYKQLQITTERGLNRKVSDLETSISKTQIDRTEINILLRMLLNEIVINYPEGTLDFNWKHNNTESSLTYTWPTEEKHL